ncbi:MAG: hypothetical protein M3336_14440, partial [Chloroflexota bacterium]|nr:hypothetical protein [Chloroflexota bacterium]
AQRAASHEPAFVARLPASWRFAGSGLAAALALTLLLTFSPGAQTTAAAFLAQFRSQQVAAVEISPSSQAEIARTLGTLANLGHLQASNTAVVRGTAVPRLPEARVASLSEANQQVGFALRTPNPAALPAGLEPTPKVQVIPANQIRFTFDKSRASSYLRSRGQAQVNLPDRFDGATLVVSMPAAALLSYSGKDTPQALVIGQSGELVVDVQGQVSLDEMRDFLLGLPGLPRETTEQLRMMRNWSQTLPVPIPSDRVHWKNESFQGSQGLLLNDNSGVGSAAIWQSGGRLYGVAGSLKADELKRVADSLAVR